MRLGLITGVVITALTVNAHATTFTNNEFVEWSQVAWGDIPTPFNAAGLLNTDFNSVYAPEGDLFQIGLPAPAGFSLIWSNPGDLLDFLPASGMPGPLNADIVDPHSSAAGSFAGEVAALKLNIDFSDAGLLTHPAGVAFGDLDLVNFAGTLADLNGLSLRDLLSETNVLLGGGSGSNSIDDIFATLSDVNMSFNGGPVTAFAQEHLQIPGMIEPVAEPGTIALLGPAILVLTTLRRRRVSARPDM
jgi:hypothetical protein